MLGDQREDPLLLLVEVDDEVVVQPLDGAGDLLAALGAPLPVRQQPALYLCAIWGQARK
ncbi:hypothetical protein ACFLIM_16285 [Nonomuraea sp. M3C6]|uniref:Uncharacterized protein n=1 Tax=Nonomuraea marmarensis TaxID=3351344 RepID=A0ABW7AEK6_9ACTN